MPNAVTPNQNTPGAIYNSESNFVFPIPGQNTYAGLADYGTRLKATFNNIPAGVSVYVSVNNVSNLVTPLVAPAIPGGTSIASWAQLVNSETANDGVTGSSYFPAVTASTNAVGAVGIAQVPITAGTGAAVWEVLNTNPNQNETFNFGVYLLYTSNVAQSAPLTG